MRIIEWHFPALLPLALPPETDDETGQPRPERRAPLEGSDALHRPHPGIMDEVLRDILVAGREPEGEAVEVCRMAVIQRRERPFVPPPDEYGDELPVDVLAVRSHFDSGGRSEE